MTYKVLCIVPSLPEKLSAETVRSILNQTYPIEMLIILSKKSAKTMLPAKVSDVLNDGLSHIHLKDFDYILRVDGDTVVPPNFLEINLKEHADCCGRTGCAMLIKVSTFLRLMNGKFHPELDDTYLGLKFMKEGATVIAWKVAARHSSVVRDNVYEYSNRGKLMYKAGYEPVHLIVQCLVHTNFWTIKDVFGVWGYFAAALNRTPKYEVADYVWRRQVNRLLLRRTK